MPPPAGAVQLPCGGATLGGARRARRRHHHARARSIAVAAALRDEAGEWIAANAGAGAVRSRAAQGSSDWASFYRYDTESGKSFFVKQSRRGPEMFHGESWGLRTMHATATLRVPNALHAGPLQTEPGSFIVMEFLDFGGSPDQATLGRQLALMHKAAPLCVEAAAGRFGFPVDNTIGGTTQGNAWSAGSGTAAWVDFFAERRLRPQCARTREPTLQRLGDKLCERLPALFDMLADEITPATLHGDLWSGNIASVGGAPAVYDPASYYGHSEAEFGMSWCAGFGPAFWRAYHEVLPRAPGFERREKLYKLYHYLNHYNLFGGGYYQSAVSLLSELTA